MKRLLLVIIVVTLYLLHQDYWFWRTPSPLVFGFIPIGLFYHACYSLAVPLVMWLLVKYAWPAHLEEDWGDGEVEGGRDTVAPRPVAPSPSRPVPSSKEGAAR
jgi:hypothetical protein